VAKLSAPDCPMGFRQRAVNAIYLSRCLAIVFILILDAFVFRMLWLHSGFAVGEFKPGFFEKIGDKTTITFVDGYTTEMFPSFSLDEKDRLVIPPDRVIEMRLFAGYEIRVESQNAARAAYVVFGNEVP
jgi:hypothetical protein